MLDPATGMRAGLRYRVENLEREHQFPGFFLDGKYYLGPELLTAVGWLEGNRFIYDNLDASGEPLFPERIAGDIAQLTLTLVDGARLALSPIEDWPDDPTEPNEARPSPSVPRRRPLAILLAAAVLGVAAGYALETLRRKRR